MIQTLSPHVADLIAAGEVVERPASAAKELLENALDAGANRITLELRHGGLTYLRVTDNGCGIPAKELPTAFLRHATSKLSSAEELDAIGTLGFRGEALAAIASVSRISISSRPANCSEGARLTLEGGRPSAVRPVGCPVGTDILIQELFFNTPARLKFMKKDSSEAAAVLTMVQQLAISRPEVSFRVIKDGQEVLYTTGDGNLQNAIYASMGREFALSLIPVEGRDDAVVCQGFVTKPLQCRGTRGSQLFFVNNRLVKNQILSTALEEAYRNQLMKGKFPGCVLHLTVPLYDVDVNVHPAKTQVKFLKERRVFDTIYYTVLDALQQDSVPPVKTAPSATISPPKADFFQSMTTQAYREQYLPKTAPKVSPVSPAIAPAIPSQTEPKQPDALPTKTNIKVAEPSQQEKNTPDFFYDATPPKDAMLFLKSPKAEKAVPSTPSLPLSVAEQTTLLAEAPPWRMIGEVFHTYILCEDADSTLWLIDKHAAHERLLFDKLLQQSEPVMRQTLLTPLPLDFAPEVCTLLTEHPDLLTEAGFTCEDFGTGTLLVREIPADLGEAEVSATLEQLAELFRSPRPNPSAQREALLKTVACKAAVKAGMVSGDAERRALVRQVQNGTITHCPHGRPVAVQWSRYELEKQFQRA